MRTILMVMLLTGALLALDALAGREAVLGLMAGALLADPYLIWRNGR